VNLFINGVNIPKKPTKLLFESILGKPSRIDRREKGIRYVYDKTGLTFSTSVENDTVLTMMLINNRKFKNFKKLPKNNFVDGELFINGIKLPKTNSIQDAMVAIPEIKPDLFSFGNNYEIDIGEKKIVFFTPIQSDIEWVIIVLSIDNSKYDKLLKQSKLLEQSLSLYKSLQSYSDLSVVETNVIGRGMDLKIKTQLLFRFERPNRIRILGNNDGKGNVIIVSDGTTIVNYVEATKHWWQKEAPKVLYLHDLNEPNLSGPLQSMFVPRLILTDDPIKRVLAGVEKVNEVGQEKVNGHSVTVIELVQPESSVMAYEYLWIGNEDFLIYKYALEYNPMKRYSVLTSAQWKMVKGRKTQLSVIHSGININPVISEETFKFKSPQFAK